MHVYTYFIVSHKDGTIKTEYKYKCKYFKYICIPTDTYY